MGSYCERFLSFFGLFEVVNWLRKFRQWRNQAIIHEAIGILKTSSSFLGFLFKHRKGSQVADRLSEEARKQGIHKQQSFLYFFFFDRQSLPSDVVYF